VADDQLWARVRALPAAQRDATIMRYVDDLPLDAARDLIRAMPDASIVMGIGCIGDKPALTTEPEFPLNEHLVDVQPAGLPLIIAEVDIGGDDSVAGQVIYVWLEEQFDGDGPVGWQAAEVLVGEVCARGGSAGEELCP